MRIEECLKVAADERRLTQIEYDSKGFIINPYSSMLTSGSYAFKIEERISL